MHARQHCLSDSLKTFEHLPGVDLSEPVLEQRVSIPADESHHQRLYLARQAAQHPRRARERDGHGVPEGVDRELLSERYLNPWTEMRFIAGELPCKAPDDGANYARVLWTEAAGEKPRVLHEAGGNAVGCWVWSGQRGHLTERMQDHYSTVSGAEQRASIAKVITLMTAKERQHAAA